MKKCLLGLLLTIALVLPIFAEQSVVTTEQKEKKSSSLELIPKIGWIFSPEATFDYPLGKKSYSKDSAFSIGADLFFDLNNNLFLGFGLMFGSNHEYCDNDNYELGFTNLYLAIKYKCLVNASEKDPLYIYPLLNLGVGFPGWEFSGAYGTDYELTPGFYWAVGIGWEYKNIILEFIYGCNYSKEEYNESFYHRVSNDFSYTAFRINLGYKFAL